MISRLSSLVDVAFIVCDALARKGTVAVLTGGSAATYYAVNDYTSADIDFVITFRTRDAAAVLRDLGFFERGGTYIHRDSPYIVEFPPGPLSVGDDLVTVWDTIERKGLTLFVITRTDCVRDRLAAYYHWDDYQSLYVARDVAKSGLVDWNLINTWSNREGHGAKLRDFLQLVEG